MAEKQINCAVLSCSCINEGQDKMYGKGRRLHNKMKDGSFRCTVCRKEKQA